MLAIVIIIPNYRRELWFPDTVTRRAGTIKGCRKNQKLQIFCETRQSETGARNGCCRDFDKDCYTDDFKNENPLRMYKVVNCLRKYSKTS